VKRALQVHLFMVVGGRHEPRDRSIPRPLNGGTLRGHRRAIFLKIFDGFNGFKLYLYDITVL